MSRLLRADAKDSLRAWVETVNSTSHRLAWSELLDSVVTGRNAFTTVHGTDVWAYRAEHPEEGAVFDAAMTALTRSVVPAVVAAYDLAASATLVDVGGGQGALLAAFLVANPGPDAEIVAILGTVREAMEPTSVLLIVERVLAGPNEGLPTKLGDLNMLVAPGGLERTEAEFDALFTAAGLRRTRTVPTGGAFDVLEAQAG